MTNSEENPVVIQVHPLLLEEFKFLKDKIEDKVGYKIYGGMPIVSKLIAIRMKEMRLKNKQVTNSEIIKIKNILDTIINEEEKISVVMRVHPILLDEFKIKKIEFEYILKHKIKGGMPIVSKAIAMQMKEIRLKNNIQDYDIQYSKVKGEKKIKLLI